MRSGDPSPARRTRGFTLIELLVVLSIMALLLAIAAPRYFGSISKAREAAVRSNLRLLRDAIDRFDSDRNRYPETLQQLVDLHYLRNIPVDSMTDSAATWTTTPPPDGAATGVYDVHSGAAGSAGDGTPYAGW